MKFTILKETFEDRLSLSSRFTSHRVSAVQSIQGAQLIADKEGISITTTNLSDFFHTTVSAKVDVEGTVIFELKKALEFLNFLQVGDVVVELDGNTLTISQGKTKGNFSIYPANDFPELPHLDGKTYSIESNLLQKLSLVLFSASKDETRPVMTGVYATSEGDRSFFVTTDGFRLSLLEHVASDAFKNVILPATIFTEVTKLAKGDGVSMTLSPEDRLIKFTIGDIDLYSRIIEGDFPPYEKVIPQTTSTTIQVSVQEFVKNIRLVSVFAREQADVVIFDISDDGMYIRPKASQQKESHVFQQLESFEGEAIKIAFNYKYVLEFLNTISSDTITFECTQPAAPGAFKADTESGYVHIIMPLRTEETTG